MLSVKKILLPILISSFFSISAFSGEFKDNISFELGIGAGFASYGSSGTRDYISAVPDDHKIILNANALFLYPLEKRIFLTAGFDNVFDARWGGGEHIFLWDYSIVIGFRVYPNLGGLCLDVQYALGRRTDFCDFEISMNGETVIIDETESTGWGNGFVLGLAYDFSYHTSFIAPELSFNWKHIPRGNSSDNYLNLSFRIKI